jgi:cytochrome c553
LFPLHYGQEPAAQLQGVFHEHVITLLIAVAVASVAYASEPAKATAEAAGMKDEAAVKGKLVEIKATCSECHARIRDKK